jgi:hypothetical protein
VREASRRQTVKKQTSINLVHNSPMIPINVTFGRRLITGALGLALVAVGCTSVSPVPSAPPNNVPTNPAVTGRPTQPLGTPNATTGQPATGAPTVPAASPTPGGTVTGTPTANRTPSGPQATVDPAIAAQIDQVTSQVPPIRMLQPTKTVPYQIISRDDFQSYLLSTTDEDTTPEWRTAEQNFFKRLGLLPQDADLNALLLQLYTSEVAAYYNPVDGTFYIIDRNAPFGPIDEVTTAHEYTHALQDQHFDLEGNRIKDPAEGDQSLAQLSVIEGDATLTSQNWMKDNMSQADQLQLLQDALGQLGNDQLATMPLILRRQLEFPYTEGLLFTTDVWGLGGYGAVNQAIQTPPASTEQIIHSDKYYNHEAPVAVTLTDLTSALGTGFTNDYQQTMGELNIQVLATGGEKPPIDIPGLPAQWPHAEVAAGWGGDKLNMYDNASNGQWLIDWQTAWDTQADADEFTARMNELAATFQGSLRLIPGPQTVRFVLASDPSLFLALPSG